MFFENLKKAVFIGAHTDDEMMVAGTLRKLVKVGVDVRVLIFSYAPIPGKTHQEAAEILRPEFIASMNHIGVRGDNFEVAGLDPRTMPDHQSQIRQRVYDFTEKEKPDLAFILSSTDDHQDHSILGKICQIVMKNRIPNIIRCHYPWNFVPAFCNVVVPLTLDELETKFNVIRVYKSQLFRYDFESIFRSLTDLDGFTTKNPPAEAFEILRLTVGSRQ